MAGLPAALWVERHEPAVAAATCWYLSTWEWLAFRLTGVATGPLVPDQTVPALDRVAATGIAVDRLPPRTATGATVGDLTDTAADALGLRPGIPVVGGTVDAFASYLGAGLLEPGDAYDPGGSAGGFGVYWDRPLEVPGGFVTPAPLAGRYSVGAAMAATGRALDWYRRTSWAARSRPRRSWPRRPRPHPAPTASSSCRTSPVSGRRSGTRRRAACSPV